MHLNIHALTKTTVGLAMILENEVRIQMAKVISQEISISDFVLWIMSNSWNMDQDSSPDVVDLVSSIHLLLAERDDSSIDDATFLSQLHALNMKITKFIEVVETPKAQSPMLNISFSASRKSAWVASLAALL